MTGAVQATLILLQREWLRFIRQRSRVIGAFVTPLLFWILLGSGLSGSFVDPAGTGQSYLQFFFPGMIMMSVLFTAIFSTISVIEDRNEGFLQGILVSPQNQMTFVLAKVLGGALLGLIQAQLILILAPFLGFQITLQSWIHINTTLFLCGTGLTALGFMVAWITNSMQGYHSMMNLLLFPLWLLSGAVFPVEGKVEALRWIAIVNPVAHGMGLMRAELGHPSVGFSPSWLYLTLFTLSCIYASYRLARRS